MDFFITLLRSMPNAVGQGLIWGIMAIGVYLTFRILDVADLTVDGSLATGGAVCVLLTVNGVQRSGSPCCAPSWRGCWPGWPPDCSTPSAAFRPSSPAS